MRKDEKVVYNTVCNNNVPVKNSQEIDHGKGRVSILSLRDSISPVEDCQTEGISLLLE